MTEKPNVVLSIYPNAYGLGYICLSWPKNIIDFGLATTRPLCNRKLFKRFMKFIQFYKPEIVLLRESDNLLQSAKRSHRLIRKMAEHAEQMKLPVFRYSRQQVRDVFDNFNSHTKYEIALTIAEGYPELKNRMPKLRGKWRAEDPHMAIFDAMALTIAHKYLAE